MKFQTSFLTFTAFLVAFWYAQSCPTATLKLKLPSLIFAGSKFHAYLSLTNTDGSSLDDADINLHLPDYLSYVAKSSKPIADSIEEDSVIGETDIWWKAVGPIERKKTVDFKLDLEVDKCAPSHFEIYAAASFGGECMVEVTKEIKLKHKKKKQTCSPTKRPTSSPTTSPTSKPTLTPTKHTTSSPTTSPTSKPTLNPTKGPTSTPTYLPTALPTGSTASTCNGNGNCNDGMCYTEIGNCTNQQSYQACLTTLNFTNPVIPCSSCPNQPASISCTGAESGSCVVGMGHGPTNCMIPGAMFDQGFCYCSSSSS